MNTRQPMADENILLPAPSDVVIAWPHEPQQLFLLIPGGAQPSGNWQAWAQTLARQFPQGVVAVLAASQSVLQGRKSEADAVAALHALLQGWQGRAGLDFTRTALIAEGVAASVAMQAAMQHADCCARLFALGGQLPETIGAISEQTCLHWLLAADADVPAKKLQEQARQLQALDVDFTLDILQEGSATSACAPAMQQRMLHLLQNHVPRRLWREALASAAALEKGDLPPGRMH